jgi:hypothetical protein
LAPHVQDDPMKFLRSRRGAALSLLLFIVALYVVRPGAAGLKARMGRSITQALGRQVEIGDMHLHLLPQPGFDLDNFIVHDDGAFGAEPLLRASEVNASLRFASLLRGRLEVSQLTLIEPSVNLVLNDRSEWNVEYLLRRTSDAVVAPTAKAPKGPIPAFPYIELKRGRVNFKLGVIKKNYSLTDADFAFWQESENEWGMRLKARPVRTDLNLSDTGLLTAEGTWKRAKNLSDTPLKFDLQWDDGQLGQISKLISGEDKGWRGGVTLKFALTGTPADLNATATSTVQDFHRYDIIDGDPVRLSAHCLAHYNSSDGVWREIICGAPVGEGTIALQGKLSARNGGCDLILNAEQIPAEDLAMLARRAKRDMANDLAASGKLDTKLAVRGDSWHSLLWQGGGQLKDLHVQSAANAVDLAVGRVPFSVNDESELTRARNPQRQKLSSTEWRLEIGPAIIGLGRSGPLVSHASIGRRGYSFNWSGEGQVKRLLQLARTFGLPAFQPKADGNADLNLTASGAWQNFASPTITGTAELSNVSAEVRGLNAPINIVSAELKLQAEEIRIRNLRASLGDLKWTGAVSLPRHCASWSSCPINFDLHADLLNTELLNLLLNPHPAKTPWYKVLSPAQNGGSSPLLSLRATGKLSANRFVARKLEAAHVTADVRLQDGKLTASNLRAELFGGKHDGEWHADFTAKPPRYGGSGKLEHASLTQVGKAVQNEWSSGTTDASYSIAFLGYNMTEQIASANGEAQFVMQDGAMPQIMLQPGGPLHFHRFTGVLSLSNSAFRIEEGKLVATSGIYDLSGTAAGPDGLNLVVTHDGVPKFDITGTLRQPLVRASSRPETRAELKP